jgi:hypothetical protein
MLRRSSIDVGSVYRTHQGRLATFAEMKGLMSPSLHQKLPAGCADAGTQPVGLFKRLTFFNFFLWKFHKKNVRRCFEAYCHMIFSTRIEFDFVPMVRTDRQPTVREKRMAQWFSSDTEFSGSVQSQALERASTLASGASLDVYPSRVVNYDSDDCF